MRRLLIEMHRLVQLPTPLGRHGGPHYVGVAQHGLLPEPAVKA